MTPEEEQYMREIEESIQPGMPFRPLESSRHIQWLMDKVRELDGHLHGRSAAQEGKGGGKVQCPRS